MAGNNHVANEVLRWICPNCGKHIVSLYTKQFDYLIAQHNLTHERKKLGELEDNRK